MSCPVNNGNGLFRQLPLLTFEVLFVYLLVSRYSIRFILFTSTFITFCVGYCVYWKFRYKSLFNFHHTTSSPNDKAIPLPTTSTNTKNKTIHNSDHNDIVIYHYRTTKSSVFDRLRHRYHFAMPSNLRLSPIPDHELNASEFIKLWKEQFSENNNTNPFTLKLYCIDPFDLSVWILRINVDPLTFDAKLSSLQYDWNRTINFYLNSSDHSIECSVYRIARDHFIKICQSMEREHHLLRSMKYLSSRMCLVFDSDFESHCSTGDNLGYLLHFTASSGSGCDSSSTTESSTDDLPPYHNGNGIHFISNNPAFTALQFRYVQMKRAQTLNASELKRFQSRVSMLFYHYFLFLYGTECGEYSHRISDRLLLRMCTSDLFWTDILKMALPGMRKLFVYQSIYKSLERAFNVHHQIDSMCYCLSWFCLDDLYIRHCTGYPFHYMLQEAVTKFNEFHSDFLYHCCNDEDVDGNEELNPSDITLANRDEMVLSQRDTAIDLGCRILAVLVYVMHCIKGNEFSIEDPDDDGNGIEELKHNFLMIRYDMIQYGKAVEVIEEILERLGWNAEDINVKQHEEKIVKLLRSTQQRGYTPKSLNQDQQKRLSFLFAQYEHVDYVQNVQ